MDTESLFFVGLRLQGYKKNYIPSLAIRNLDFDSDSMPECYWHCSDETVHYKSGKNSKFLQF